MRHHIVFGTPDDHMKVSYQDAAGVEGTIYQPEYLPGKPRLIKKLHTAHCLVPFGGKKKMPLRKAWYGQYCDLPYRQGDEYVFVFFFNWYPIFQNGYLDYLKEHYPGCKCVLFLCDINQARRLDMDLQKKLFDHVMVFERNFAREHEIAYYPLVYSDFRHEIRPEEKDIDLLFVGWAKGRYKLLKQIYDKATAAGVNCQFYLTKLDEEVPEDSGIHTADWVPYPQYKALLKRAKCMLDIVPPNTDCSTLRLNEAMSHLCKILTNNTLVVNETFYDPDSISVYASPEQIDVEFLKKPYESPAFSEHTPIMGPEALARYLDKVLYQEGE